PADQITDADEEGGEGRHQNAGADQVDHEMPLGIVMRLAPPHVGIGEAAKKAAALVRRESEARKAAARGAARACRSRRAAAKSERAGEERRAKAERNWWTEGARAHALW